MFISILRNQLSSNRRQRRSVELPMTGLGELSRPTVSRPSYHSFLCPAIRLVSHRLRDCIRFARDLLETCPWHPLGNELHYVESELKCWSRSQLQEKSEPHAKGKGPQERRQELLLLQGRSRLSPRAQCTDRPSPQLIRGVQMRRRKYWSC